MGHRKEQCPYIVRHHSPPRTTEESPERERVEIPCNKHEPDNANKEEGPTVNMHGSVHENVPESTYGPWVVVARKKQGTRKQGSGGPSLSMSIGFGQQVGGGTKFTVTPGLAELSSGPSRDSKRKITRQDDITGQQVASVIQHIVKGSSSQARNTVEESPGSFQVEKLRSRPGKEIIDSKPIKPKSQASVKGKKALARNRAPLTSQLDAAEGTKSTVSSALSASLELGLFDGEPASGSDGRQLSRGPSPFLFSTMPNPKVGHQLLRRGDRDSKNDAGRAQISESNRGVGQKEVSDGMEADLSSQGGVCEGGQLGNVRPSVEGRENSMAISLDGFFGNGGGVVPSVDYAGPTSTSSTVVRNRINGLPDREKDEGEVSALHAPCGGFEHVTRGGSDRRDGDPDRMEFEGGGEFEAAC